MCRARRSRSGLKRGSNNSLTNLKGAAVTDSSQKHALTDSLGRASCDLNVADLEPLMASIGDARFVLIDEASHGTSEFYSWRARLPRQLVEEKGFPFVAVEGDWPDCYRVNRYVKGYEKAGENVYEVLHAFRRWSI